LFETSLYENSNIGTILENDKRLLAVSIDNLLFGSNGQLTSPRESAKAAAS
jgi:hypothetical protein